jgi:xanthine dehydrogenase accessory factor
VVWLTTGALHVCAPASTLDRDVPAELQTAAAAAVAQDGPSCAAFNPPFSLYRRYDPALRLMVVGADPIALALTRLAREMNIETILIRPKGPDQAPLPGLTYEKRAAERVLAEIQPDPWTAVAVLTHDLDEEHAALCSALSSEAGYVGTLGSRRRIPERQRRLQASGVSLQNLARLHAPIGLATPNKSPWGVAVSILAEIMGMKHRAPCLEAGGS